MKSNQSGLKVYLLLVFLVPYLLWGIILLAQELGWFNYGESFLLSLLFLPQIVRQSLPFLHSAGSKPIIH